MNPHSFAAPDYYADLSHQGEKVGHPSTPYPDHSPRSPTLSTETTSSPTTNTSYKLFSLLPKSLLQMSNPMLHAMHRPTYSSPSNTLPDDHHFFPHLFGTKGALNPTYLAAAATVTSNPTSANFLPALYNSPAAPSDSSVEVMGETPAEGGFVGGSGGSEASSTAGTNGQQQQQGRGKKRNAPASLVPGVEAGGP
ncbi:hypothetical protein JCM6882_007582 [Rhodosporidiobolus microsporus]